MVKKKKEERNIKFITVAPRRKNISIPEKKDRNRRHFLILKKSSSPVGTAQLAGILVAPMKTARNSALLVCSFFFVPTYFLKAGPLRKPFTFLPINLTTPPLRINNSVFIQYY